MSDVNRKRGLAFGASFLPGFAPQTQRVGSGQSALPTRAPEGPVADAGLRAEGGPASCLLPSLVLQEHGFHKPRVHVLGHRGQEFWKGDQRGCVPVKEGQHEQRQRRRYASGFAHETNS